MANPQLIGNKDGITLWKIMSKSKDTAEIEYFKSIKSAAQANRQAWFTDMITRRETNEDQVMWHLNWTGSDWKISLFSIPKNGKVNKRIANHLKPEIIQITSEDIIGTI